MNLIERKSRAAKENPRRAGKNFPGGAKRRIRAALRTAEATILLESAASVLFFAPLPDETGCLAVAGKIVAGWKNRRPALF